MLRMVCKCLEGSNSGNDLIPRFFFPCTCLPVLHDPRHPTAMAFPGSASLVRPRPLQPVMSGEILAAMDVGSNGFAGQVRRYHSCCGHEQG
jgi:hypothetical protein